MTTLKENYTIDYSDWYDEGGCCQVYPIKNNHSLIFKEFRSKKNASQSLAIQKKLCKFDLAPKLYSSVCKLRFAPEKDIIFDDTSDWGYITEKATIHDKVPLNEIQKLVEEIYYKTKLKFWDCHYYNVGFVGRSGKSKLVCIDTGKESFVRDSNAWGLNSPGPKCSYCKEYQCKCSEY
jgi:hypothetical protein